MYLIFLYIVLTLADVGFLLSQLYFIVQYTDLESDYVNPIDMCSSLERLVPFEAIGWAAVSALLLLSGEWVSFLVSLPVTLYNGYAYQQGWLRYDATTIFRTLRRYKAEAFAKMAYYFVVFCYLLYSMIWAMIVHSDIEDGK